MIGQTVSHYKIVEKLGGGGMGVVYKAWDNRLKRDVALKFLPSELTRDEEFKTRFRHEAQAASALDHPNICNIHEIDETPQGRMFICMAHYEGETLKKKIARGRLSTDEAANTIDQIARGLAEAHRHGIVHRDIKPANVMITGKGKVKIVDFGLAKQSGASRITRTGRTLGTLIYMSPEQARGDAINERTDIFSLGVVWYEMLTGKIPFEGDHEAAVLYGIMHKDPEPLAKYRSDIPAGLQEIIDKALHKQVNKRYQTMSELREDLHKLTGEPSGGRSLVRRTWYRRLRSPLAVAAAVAVLLALSPMLWNTVQELFTGPPDQKHIAVLPFENMGPVSEAFSAGLVETLTSKLTQLERFHESLWVIPASEVRAWQVASPGEARRLFSVNLVFTGSIQQLGESYRLTLNLIEVGKNTPRQLRSALIDEPLTDVSALQDNTVIKAAGLLNLELGPDTQKLLTAGGTVMAAANDYYLQGRGYLQRYQRVENLDHAVSLFQRAIKEDSLYALAYAGLGEAYWRKYRHSMDTRWVEPAVKNGRRAVELNDLLAPVHVTAGMIYKGTGKDEKAIEAFQRALALDPASAAAHRGLAEAYNNLQRFDEAERTYQDAIELQPSYWGGHDDLGLFYYSRGRYDDALTAMDRVVALAPDNSRGYNILGAIYYAVERWEKAREKWEQAVRIEPDYRVYSNLGILHYIEGRYAEAAATTEKALALNNTSYITWANLANAYYWMTDKRPEAMDNYRRAAEMAEENRKINPRDPDLLSTLAGYYVVLGEGPRALSMLQEAFEIAPSNWWVLYNYGFAYEQLGDRGQALEWIEKALDAGYPLKEVERDPFLVDLRTDTRFEELATRRRG
jgi:serine/threonine-protein kinase